MQRKLHIGIPYDQNASANWFDSEWMFGITDGFDVVVGNPPYIQLQSDGGRLANLYEPCNFETFTRTGDIYCLFYEKANQLSKNGGHVCFITSNKWMRASYGKKLRNYFISHTRPLQLLDMGEDVFDATVNTSILLLQNTAPNVCITFIAATIRSDFDTHTGNIAQYLKDNGVAMELPPGDEPWAILSPAQLALRTQDRGGWHTAQRLGYKHLPRNYNRLQRSICRRQRDTAIDSLRNTHPLLKC